MINYNNHFKRFMKRRSVWLDRRPREEDYYPDRNGYKVALNWWWRERPRVTNIFSDIMLARHMRGPKR